MATFNEEIAQYPVNRRITHGRNACVAIALARALADDPTDHDDVATLAQIIGDDLVADGAMTPAGVTYGGSKRWCKKYVPGGRILVVRDKHEGKRPEDAWGGHPWHSRKYDRPTVAQFLRHYDGITEAIIRVTGHLGYYKDGIAFALGARKRVDWAYVLEEK